MTAILGRLGPQALEHVYFANSPEATAPALLPKVFSQLGEERPPSDKQLRQPDFTFGGDAMVLGGTQQHPSHSVPFRPTRRPLHGILAVMHTAQAEGSLTYAV